MKRGINGRKAKGICLSLTLVSVSHLWFDDDSPSGSRSGLEEGGSRSTAWVRLRLDWNWIGAYSVSVRCGGPVSEAMLLLKAKSNSDNALSLQIQVETLVSCRIGMGLVMSINDYTDIGRYERSRASYFLEELTPLCMISYLRKFDDIHYRTVFNIL